MVDHLCDSGPELGNAIKALVALRKRAGIRADSKLKIHCAEGDMYVASIDDK